MLSVTIFLSKVSGLFSLYKLPMISGQRSGEGDSVIHHFNKQPRFGNFSRFCQMKI